MFKHKNMFVLGERKDKRTIRISAVRNSKYDKNFLKNLRNPIQIPESN